MNKNELAVKEYLTQIIEHAEQKPNVTFKLLTNYKERRFQYKKSISLKLLIKVLSNGTIRLFKKYCDSILTETADVNRLLIINRLLTIIDYYKLDLKVTLDMIDEYDTYKTSSIKKYLWSLNGGQRHEKDLYDFRK